MHRLFGSVDLTVVRYHSQPMLWSMIVVSGSGSSAGSESLLLLLLAIVIEAYIGEARFVFRFVPHPVVLIGRLVDVLDRRLNREKRTSPERTVRGFITVLIICGLAGVIGTGIDWLTRNHPFGWPFELLLVVVLIAQRALFDAVSKVEIALRERSLEDARATVAHIIGRDPKQLDACGVARAAIESLAENFCDGVAAPIFWYMVLGLPGLLVYKAVNTLDSMIGYKNDRYRAFGFCAARLDDAFNYIPARLSGLLFAVAALFTPQASSGRAFRTMFRDADRHRSVNAGWPEGAVAGALGLTLAGPRRYPDRVVRDPWIGDGTARATHIHIRRALRLYAITGLLMTVVIGLAAVARIV